MEVDLETLAEPVSYELEMFKFLHDEIAKRSETKVGTGSDPAEDAYLESFLLHTRLLRDFFCNKRDLPPRRQKCPKCGEHFEKSRSESDDVLAVDFVAGWVQEETPYLKTLRHPLNKLLAHLTQARQPYTLRSYLWEPEKIYSELRPMIDRFLSSLPDDRKGWFQ